MPLARFASHARAQPPGEPWPPGVYFESGTPAPAETPLSPGGVPVFVGFAAVDPALRDRVGAQGIVLERWDARLWQRGVVPAPGSALRAAVRSHFANGGGRCVVLAQRGSGAGPAAADALIRVFEPGGPLADRSDVDLVCVPDAALAGPDRLQVQAAVLRHCEATADRFALLDVPPPGAGADVDDWLRLASALRSGFGALYGPWLVADPTRDAESSSTSPPEQWRRASERRATNEGDAASPQFVPPCGHVAGLIARLDRRIGPQQAPANETLSAVLDTALHLSSAQRGRLNEAGVNAIHVLPGRGVRVGGARTLSASAGWTHLPTVRVVIAFRRWVAERMRDLVFEPQTPRLWDVIRNRLVAHCLELQRAGALAGARAEDAFQVRCDAETNPVGERDAGRVVAHVALAVVVPAEFIVIRVVQDASGFTVSEAA